MRAPLTADDLAVLPDWLPKDLAQALVDPAADPGVAVLAATRLMRSDEVDGLARRLDAWLREAMAGEVGEAVADASARALDAAAAGLAALGAAGDRGAPAGGPDGGPGASAWALIAARDDAESGLWALGIGASPRERALLARAAEVDAAGARHAAEVARGLALEPEPAGAPWLRALARAAQPAWWLDPLVLAAHREAVTGWLSRPLVGARMALALTRRAADAEVAFHYGADAETELARILERPLGPPVARLFDGAVLVHAHGLADHDDAPPGLVVRDAEGRFERLLSVSLDPPGPAAPQRSDVALAWWVPLAGTGDAAHTLSVRWRGKGGDETVTLPLDPPPAREG
jgi:hypothetical protein